MVCHFLPVLIEQVDGYVLLAMPSKTPRRFSAGHRNS